MRLTPAAIFLTGLLAFVASGQALGSDLPKVASTDLCADQYLLHLADKRQITSLSDQSQSVLGVDPNGVMKLRRNRAQAEEFLLDGTQLVVLKQYGDDALEAMLHRFGIATLRLPYAATIDDVKANIELVADRIGRAQAGLMTTRDLEQALDHARIVAKTKPRRIALYLRPDGGGTGSGTFVHAAMDAAGFDNLQARLGQTGWASLPLEQLAQLEPDVVITSFFDNPLPSVANRKVRHPLVQAAIGNRPQFDVPGHLWICGGPGIAQAVRLLTAFAGGQSEGGVTR